MQRATAKQPDRLELLKSNLRVVANACDNLIDFAQYIRHDYEATWYHRLIAEHLQDMARGKLRRLIISLPPRHGKTELISRLWPAWLFGQRPSLRIMACSHTATLAEQISRDVRRVVLSEEYRRLFQDVAEPVRNNRQLKSTHTFWETGQGGSYRATGVGGAITGHGFDIGIIDDPIKNREEADSALVRDNLWDWYTNVFYTRQEPNASIVIVSTRWHRDDIVGRILVRADQRNADQWTVLKIPAIAEDDPEPYDPRSPGEALWPERFDLDALETIRAQDPRAFACLYQQNPSAVGGTEWPLELFGDFIWCDDDHWPTEFDVSAIAVDPSKGKADRSSDYSAIVFLGVKNGLLYVDADLERRPSNQIVLDTIRMCYQYKPDLLGIEANQFQELLVHEFERVAGEKFFIQWPVYKINNKINKVVRVRRLGQYITNLEIRFKRTPGSRILVDQLIDFPFSDHDDGPDALEMAARLILEIAGAQSDGE